MEPENLVNNRGVFYIAAIVFGIFIFAILILLLPGTNTQTNVPIAQSAVSLTPGAQSYDNPFLTPTTAYENPFSQNTTGQSNDQSYQNPFIGQ